MGQDDTSVTQRLIADAGDDKFAFGTGVRAARAARAVTGNAGAKARVATVERRARCSTSR